MQKTTFAFISSIFFGFIALTPFMAFAQEVNDIAENIIDSSSELPGLITGLAYLFGLFLGVDGVLRLKAHVEQGEANVPLRMGVIRLIAGGALFALPTIYEAMETTINAGEDTNFNPDGGFANGLSAIFGDLAGTGITLNFNNILANIIDSISDVPALITGFAYLAGLYMGVYGILYIKDHIEDPKQSPLKEGVIRLLIGGAFFALPTVFEAMYITISDGDTPGNVTSIVGGSSFIYSSETGSVECLSITGALGGAGAVGAGILEQITGGEFSTSSSMGNVMCNVITATASAPAFLSALSYLFGMVFGFWGLLKIRDTILNPTQTQAWEGISRLLVGGMFFALPYVVEVMRSTFVPGNLQGIAAVQTNTGFNTGPQGEQGLLETIGDFFGFGETQVGQFLGFGSDSCGPAGLDMALTCFMNDIFGPMHVLLNFFAFVAGIILIMIGISRLIKSTQEGAKGPTGLGTILTFATGGALLSFNALIRGLSTSFFGSPVTFTYASVAYLDSKGFDAVVASNAYAVINATLQFMILIGLISFVRGLFVLRGAAEGNQQASVMAGVTHIVGGALAVNLGPLLNAVQTSLGIAEYGVVFGASAGGLTGLIGGLFGG